VIVPPGGVRVLVASRPVDFRKGMDGLAALAKETLAQDPFSGTILVFRAKRADRNEPVGSESRLHRGQREGADDGADTDRSQVEGVLVDGRGDVLAEGAVVLELQKQLPMLVEMDIGRCRLAAGNSQAMQ